MKKIIISALCVCQLCAFCACSETASDGGSQAGSLDDSVSQSQNETASENADEGDAEENTGENESAEEEVGYEEDDDEEIIFDSVTVYMDAAYLTQGVNFENFQLHNEAVKFMNTVTGSYTARDYDESEDVSDGIYLRCVIKTAGEGKHTLYITSRDSEWVAVDGEYYKTSGSEIAEYYDYVTDFLTEKDYWGN